MSRPHSRPPNTYEALITDDTTQGAGTQRDYNQWIQAEFSTIVLVSTVEIGAPSPNMKGDWGADYINGALLQYWNISTDQWIDIMQLTGFTDENIDKIKSFAVGVGVETTKIRIFSRKYSWLGVGCFKIKGIQ